MKTKKNNLIITLITILIAITINGCSELQLTNQTPPQPQQNANTSKRFQQDEFQTDSPVKTAVEMSQKYASLADKHNLLKQKSNELSKQNNKLQEQLSSTTKKLKQSEKELNQANDLLIEMRIELNNWKKDILGFREEMRNADKAQLNALLKIMKLLGADANDVQMNSDLINSEPNKPDTANL